MPAARADTTFQFVDWTEVAGPTQNPATRVLIRKQAMSKAAAARRERGNWGKRNVGQSIMVPSEAQQQGQGIHHQKKTSRNISKASADHHRRYSYRSAGRTSSSSEGESGAESFQHGRPLSGYAGTDWNLEQDVTAGGYAIPLPMASTGYEMLRVQCDFDILDLSALTTFHVGRITTEGLYASPKSLIDVMRCRQWSYFSYIPCRYGQFPYLDDAAQCVASRVRGWMVGEVKPSDKVISLYLKALNSLQAAVNDPDLCTKPETLCATAVLSIYELLDNTRGLGWAQHAAGARSLVRLRGPDRFQSLFEKALFMAQIGPMYTESISENLDCFLRDPAWQAVLTSVLMDEHALSASPFSDCGSVVVLLWTDLAHLPSLWKDIQAVVCTDDIIPTARIQKLQDRVTTLDDKLTRWRAIYEPILLSDTDPTAADIRAEKRFETLGLCLTCLIILKRLAIAIDPLAAQALHVEDSAQALGEKILEITALAVQANPRAALFMRFKKEVAGATLKTSEEWRATSLVDARVNANGMIAKWVYRHWCTIKGRMVE